MGVGESRERSSAVPQITATPELHGAGKRYAEPTHLSPIRSRLSALMNPKSPVWMTAVASCSRMSLLSSWSGTSQAVVSQNLTETVFLPRISLPDVEYRACSRRSGVEGG
jgi:hypothetical protein